MMRQPNAASTGSAEPAEFIAINFCRPLEARSGNIVQTITIQRFGTTTNLCKSQRRTVVAEGW
jgi:hypothetical protein